MNQYLERSIFKKPLQIGSNITKEIVVWWRQLASNPRPLPDFIIIGAQKGGTTSLFSYLSQHPQIRPSIKKEINFFSQNFHKGLPWYRAHFPLVTSSEEITGEASPQYIFNEYAPMRISQVVPHCKLIALLRNPVERAISHYFHAMKVHKEYLPLMDALSVEEERIPKIHKSTYPSSILYKHAAYKKKGIYSEQIKRFFQCFPKKQLLIINSESFFDQPHDILKEVFRFLSIDENFKVKDLTPMNIGSNKRQVDPEVYEYLTEYFVPHNRDLYQLVGRTFDWRE